MPQLWLPFPNSTIRLTDNVCSGVPRKLGHPSDTAQEEASINEEENEGGVTTGSLPIDDESELSIREEIIKACRPKSTNFAFL